MSEQNETGSRVCSPDVERRLREAILERFSDGEWRTIDEMVAGLGDVVSDEEALAAYEQGMEEGRRRGRRWAATAPAKELARVLRCHNAWEGDWWAWEKRGRRRLSADERFFRVVRPGEPVSGASAWWTKALGNPELFDLLEAGEELLVVGFAEGAAEWASEKESPAG